MDVIKIVLIGAVCCIVYSSCTQTPVIDLSNDCINGMEAHYFLTHGMGFVDGTIVTIHALQKNCSIVLHTERRDPNIVQLIVIETTTKNHQRSSNSSISILSEQAAIILDDVLAKELLTKGIYSTVVKEHSVRIKLDGYTPAMKLTATAARSINDEKDVCIDGDELKCRVDNTTVCISAELKCDGNMNCGREGGDETAAVCRPEKYTRHLLVVLTSVTLVVFMVAVIVKLLHAALPKLPKTHFALAKRDNKLMLNRAPAPTPTLRLENREIAVTSGRNPARVLYRYRRYANNQAWEDDDDDADTEVPQEVQQQQQQEEVEEQPQEPRRHRRHRHHHKHEGEGKRRTTNSPACERRKHAIYIKPSFGRELIFLSDGEGKRHKLKKDRTIFFSS